MCELRVIFELSISRYHLPKKVCTRCAHHANNSKLTPLDGEMEGPGLGLDVETD